MTKKFVIFTFFVLLLAVFVGGLLTYRNVKKQKALERLAKINAKREEVTIRFIEGWNVRDVAGYLEKQNLVKSQDFLTLTKKFDASVFELIAQKPTTASLEGFIFPDTYRIYKPEKPFDLKTAQEIFEKALANFEKKFTPEMRAQLLKNNLNFYNAIILASIIEKETGRNAVTQEQKQKLDLERKIIAGIFYNRLKINMALQSDATINYVTEKNDPTPAEMDLQVNSPYNTYKHSGLPPGPICSPSLSSILAALYPTDTDNFYFLHTQPEGNVVYSKTHDEHVKNKLKYLK